ncbi:MAG TPA: hypothetical protein VK436_11910 [Methanocella sp.]|nr:hypothetical protein [Methanocella sp.]
MSKRTFNIQTAVLSSVIILLIICSTQFIAVADGQQLQQQSAGNFGGQASQSAGGGAESPVIQGLEGLKGFGSGHSQLSLAVIPVSQQQSQMTFQVIGFAVSIPESSEAVVYALSTPLPGIIDLSQNTMQIDLSNLASAVDEAGYIDSSKIYDTIRNSPDVMVIDIDLTSPSRQGSQTTFNVNSVDIVPPDGKMQAYSMQQPTQLVIDIQNNRLSMVAFPEMASMLSSYYDTSYTTVAPVVYSPPVPIMSPVFAPYIYPLPIYTAGFVRYNPFFFGPGFRTFFDRDVVTHFDRFSNLDRFPIRETRNNFADVSRNNLISGQRRGEFASSINTGKGVKGGIGGFRGGLSTNTFSGFRGGMSSGSFSSRGGGARMGGGGMRRR